MHSAETRSDGLRESVQKIAPTATSLTHENRLNARAAQKESASVDAGMAAAIRFAGDGVLPNETLILSCPASLVMVEANSQVCMRA